MKVLLIACLPKRPGFGETLAYRLRDAIASAGHRLEWHELFEEGFDPRLEPSELLRGFSFDSLVMAHAQSLAEADRLLIVHPDWWGQPPAILKGWIDRVFREGLAYELRGEDGYEKKWTPLLGGKKALVIVTSDSTDPARAELLRAIWVDATLGACGMEASCLLIDRLRERSLAEREASLQAAVEASLELVAG